MANKKLPGGRKSAGRVSTSAKKLVALKAGSVGVAISELPEAENLTGEERFPVVQDKETRGASVEQIKELIPSGKDGASAYEAWSKAQVEGSDTSEAAFLEYMRGKDGEDGTKITVEDIPAINGNVELSPEVYWSSYGSSQSSVFYPEYLNMAVNGTYKITATNGGVVSVQLGRWNSLFNARQNMRILFQCNSGEAEVFFSPPANSMIYWDDGTVYDSQRIKFNSDYLVLEIHQIPTGGIGNFILKQVFPIKSGDDGLSAYEVWINAQDPEADTSLEAYLAFQEGKDGKSAYQIWLEAGNEGTEDDFLNWLSKAAEINLDTSPKNILSKTENGLLVDGTHPVIPKYSESGSWQVFPEPEEIPGGYFVYSRVLTVKNPVGKKLIDDRQIFKIVRGNIGGLYYDINDNLLDVRCEPVRWIVSDKTIDITFHVIMSGKPHKSFSLHSLVEDGNEDEGTLYLKLEAQVLTGATLNQLGME